MCLAVPMEVTKINWPMAEVLADGLRREVNIQLVPDVKVGEFVLVHAGFAIQKLDANAAGENMKLWKQMKF